MKTRYELMACFCFLNVTFFLTLRRNCKKLESGGERNGTGAKEAA